MHDRQDIAPRIGKATDELHHLQLMTLSRASHSVAGFRAIWAPDSDVSAIRVYLKPDRWRGNVTSPSLT